MGKFSIKVDQVAKIIYGFVEGTISPEEGRASVDAYGLAISGVPSREYELRADCRGLNISAPETLPMLEASFELFKQAGFRKVVLTTSEDPIVKRQLSRVAGLVGLEAFELVDK